jgi:hypothetical protein
MNVQNFQELERLCDAPLPAEYLALLDSYPDALRSVARADDGSDSEGLVADVELLARLPDIVEINREVRLGSILDPEGREFRWPDQLLVIGETGDGDYYCVDTDGENTGVLQFRHHAVEFEVIADSLNEFVEMLVEAFVTGSEGHDDSDEDFPE